MIEKLRKIAAEKINLPYVRKTKRVVLVTGIMVLLLPVILLVVGQHQNLRGLAAVSGSGTLEAENGTVSGNVSIISDASASGGKAIVFNAAAVTPALSPSPATDQTKYTLVVVPDTQVMIANWPADFMVVTKWIADNAVSQNFKYVLQEGDITESATDKHFTDARAGMNQLDGKVPYIITIGNHDIDAWPNGGEAAITADRRTTRFNTYFPVSKFQTWPTFGSTYPAGTNENAFHKFSAGGTDWGIVTLKYNPTTEEVNWANGIVSANPSRRFIILTHDYMYFDQDRSSTGQRIWDNLVKKYKNISYVFSGHYYPDPARRVDLGLNGNTVHQLKVDYQNYTVREPNTYIRLMTFDPVNKTIEVKTYSPVYNKYMTDAPSQFILTNVPMGPVN
jgi:hypothetical protein